MEERSPLLGVGFYIRAEAARLLKVHPARLNRWMHGYTYKLREESNHIKRHKGPIVHVDLSPVDNTIALSFVELMELRIVKSFLDRGISLQRIRVAAERAMELFNTAHPFAARRVFSGGKAIFAELSSGQDMPDLVELTKSGHLQIFSGPLMSGYLDEISFSDKTLLADRWWPLSNHFPVVLDPKIAFGAPVVEGTATRTEIVAAMAKATSPDVTANVYQLTKRQVQASVQFEDLLAA
jgi:uncharacterized protein (DUF433 family)